MEEKGRFKAKDKVTQKMSRDGLVEHNHATGEEQRVSQRGQEFSLKDTPTPQAAVRGRAEPYGASTAHRPRPQTPQPEPIVDIPTQQPPVQNISHSAAPQRHADPTRGAAGAPKQRGTEYARRFAEHPPDTPQLTPERGNRQGREPHSETPRQNTAAPDAGAANTGKPNSRLHFASDEKAPEPPGKKLTNARRKAERADAKLEKARGKLPTKKRIRKQRVFNEEKGRAKTKLVVEKQVKSQRQHIKGALPLRPVRAGTNSALAYGHKKLYGVEHENVGTKAAHRGEMVAEAGLRKAYSLHRTRPYRRVAKLERAAQKSGIKLTYQQALHDNPQLKSSILSRWMQKQKIKRQYAKAAREAHKAAKRSQKAGSMVGRAGRAVGRFIRRHPKLVAIVFAIALLLVCLFNVFSSCASMAGGGFSAIMLSSYMAEDADIDNAELLYTELETDLQLTIAATETSFPGYDEYRYAVGNIGHNPFELMAWLTAVYQDFSYAQVEPVLRAAFGEQYTLTYTEETEIRTRTETAIDPETGEETEVEVEYEWHILHTSLTARSFTEVVAARMDAGQAEMYGIYMQTKGNRQYLTSPFDFNWLPHVSSYYGYRVHPTSGEKDYHKGVDIAVPVGTPILAGHGGVVTTAAYDASYGWYVVIDGEHGVQSKYAHCDTLLVGVGQTVERGQQIAISGNSGTSTGPHLHLEVLKNGQYLNALYFAETLDDGSGMVVEYPEYPGAPMGDGSFAALIEEAQKHLGKPYVFGASGPDTFDCSGFVCYSLNQSGVASVGRTTAQGLFNMCTPVSPENAQPGDLVFFTGTYSTPNACSHIGIYIGNNMMVHAGDPVGYASLNDSYWQQHLYAFGRI